MSSGAGRERPTACLSAIFTRATLASAASSCRRVYVCLSVRLSVTSRCSIETVKLRIMKITPHDSPEALVF